MDKKDLAPSYWRKFSSVWIDFVLLFGAYLLLGYISEHVFQEDAYPPPTGMQLYSERDFAVYWFFVQWILILSTIYLFFCYRFIGFTLGQRLVGIKVLNKSGEELNYSNIILRILVVLFVLLLLMIPGPIAALLFILMGAQLLNVSFSVTLLLLVVSLLVYISYSRYVKGETRSLKDKLSKTIVVDLRKWQNKISNADSVP